MDKVSEPAVEHPSQQAELSIEISRLVSRILSGENVDTTLSGTELAIRYPDAGMSGEMIARAITRAAGMVGMIRDGAAADLAGATADPGSGGSSSGDELSVAISADLEELMSEEASANGAAQAPEPAAVAATADDIAAKDMRLGAVIARSAFAAVRRAFFRG